MRETRQILDRFEAVCVNWNMGARAISTAGRVMGGFNTCTLCEGCAARRNCRDALYAGNISAQLGISYMHQCQLGGVLFSGTLIEDDRAAAYVILGPVRMWDWDDYAREELEQNCRRHPALAGDFLPGGLEKAMQELPQMDCRAARDVGQLLFDICAAISCEGDYLARQRDSYQQQAQLFDAMESDKGSDEHGYPLNTEKELLQRVRVGDRNGARAILNELLGHIFYGTGGNIELIKARSLELVVMISRAAVEAGAELDKLLGMNYAFISELSGMDSFDDICLWLVRVLEKFMDTVYKTRVTPNMLLLRSAAEYIGAHYSSNITLDGVAAQVHISPYYLSHLFRDELGITFIEYITKMRIDKAKKMLRETSESISGIAQTVGYDDAGYFSKVFKKMTGSTPAGYRKG